VATNGAAKPLLAATPTAANGAVAPAPAPPPAVSVPVPPVPAAESAPLPDSSQPNKKEVERAAAYELLCTLHKCFPDTFVRDWDKPVRPFVTGVRRAVEALLPAVPKSRISKAISYYLSRVRLEYLQAIIDGHARIDLEGKEGAVPTEEEREAARQQLEQWRQRWRERKQQQQRSGQGKGAR
jgi:sRNA-binding protein